MPELPDVEVYVEALQRRVGGQELRSVKLSSPFLLRSVDPPLSASHGRVVRGFRRLGKRIVWELEGELFLVLHLMIAGRLRWREGTVVIPKKRGLAAFEFDVGTVLLTEEGSKKRASLYAVQGEQGLAEHDPGGIEVFAASADEFKAALTRNNHTLKRALTDPRIFSGIGNAYSDEILHATKLSPIKQTNRLDDDEIDRLYHGVCQVLELWTRRLREQVGEGFPEKVTAFREGMAVHGRFGEPCPVCKTKIQRIVYRSNETNYCPECQTGGKLLADRSLSRLLGKDWPRSPEELEERRKGD